MESKLPISVCIISGAEAHRIGQALKSVAGWTSEIVVVLNEDVRDGTDKIAESFGAKVFREPWKGHKTQKNSALEKASNEWVLGLDADEVVSDDVARLDPQRLCRSGDDRQMCGILISSNDILLRAVDSAWRLVSGLSKAAGPQRLRTLGRH